MIQDTTISAVLLPDGWHELSGGWGEDTGRFEYDGPRYLDDGLRVVSVCPGIPCDCREDGGEEPHLVEEHHFGPGVMLWLEGEDTMVVRPECILGFRISPGRYDPCYLKAAAAEEKRRRVAS